MWTNWNREAAALDAEGGDKIEVAPYVKEETLWTKHVTSKIPVSIRESRISKFVFHVRAHVCVKYLIVHATISWLLPFKRNAHNIYRIY